MADMRVHELAKEFGMDNKEFLARLIEMKIPVKTHSSTLNEAFVARIRKQLEPEMADRTAEVESERQAEAERKAEEERQQKKAAEAERRKAVAEERARRRQERAEREGLTVEELEALETRQVLEQLPVELPLERIPASGNLELSDVTTAGLPAEITEAPAVSEIPGRGEKPAVRTIPTVQIVNREDSSLGLDEADTLPSIAMGETAQAAIETDTAEPSSELPAKTELDTDELLAVPEAAASISIDDAGSAGVLTLDGVAVEPGKASKAGKPVKAGAAIEAEAEQITAEQVAETDTETATVDDTEALIEPESKPGKPARYSGLLSQIEAENARLAAERDAQQAAQAKPEAKAAKAKASKTAKPKDKAALSEAPVTEEPSSQTPVSDTRPTTAKARKKAAQAAQAAAQESDEQPARGRSKQTRKPSHAEEQRATRPLIPEDYADYDNSLDQDEEDRYRKMAVAAEQFQRDRVLAEARAAVEAATNEGEGRRRKRKEKREAQAQEKIELEAIERGIDPELLKADVIQVTSGVTVSELAEIMQVPANDIIKRLFLLGMMMTVTQSMTDDLVELIADDLGLKVRIVSPEEEYAVSIYDSPEDLKTRPPVITVMGHVDHGKTSLLDAIRKTGVVATEAGGITQHIGASVVNINNRQITFIDTPGHEAFTAMRARGAKVTDVVVLVVAADDGVMPQTIEAINHAKAAEVPIVVAINKIDRPDANLDRVRAELAEHGIISEEWGGQNLFVEVSAKEHIGIDDLLETILLQADYLELTANPDTQASGFVIEAKLDKGRGPVATVLIQRGTLHVGEMLVAGTSYGRVRAVINPLGESVDAAYPADPVEVLGLGSVPEAGDEFRVFSDERDARNLAEDRALRKRLAEQLSVGHVTLEDLFARIESGASELNLVVKADVQGSIEALKDALDKMDQSEVRINVIHSAVGGITETDVTLAAASDAIIIGFNVRPQPKARTAAEHEKVEIKLYRVIYQAIDDINAARIGMLKPEIVEEDTGSAEIREIYRVPRIGNIAGCIVETGEINSDDRVRVVRDGAIIYDGRISSLRHYREDVKSIRAGSECGIGIEDFQDIKVGDVLDAYRVREVAREV
ncbi:MAG: translation initiation factor IF-2 [Coriobacteriales bacterium]|jgi:translation initiation factor IF-2|nr:translation initiation factor IF-2 [Coriobacteriales bacterium]